MKRCREIILFVSFLFLVACEKESVNELQSPNGQEQLSDKVIKDDLDAHDISDTKFDDLILNNLSKNSINPRKIAKIKNEPLTGLDENWRDYMTGNGHSFYFLEKSEIENGALADMDVFLYTIVIGVSSGNDYKNELNEFVSQGGILITTLTYTRNIMLYHDYMSPPILTETFYTPEGGTYEGGHEILNIAPDHPIMAGVPDSFISGEQMGLFHLYENLDPSIEILATLNHDANGDGLNEPVIGTYCYGEGLIILFFGDFGGMDFNAVGGSAPEELIISLNAVEVPIEICSNNTDSDGDGIINEEDNCPNISNPDQLDYDADGIGDLCDEDIDGDGIPNEQDANPMSNIEPIVSIQGCDSGVENDMTYGGYTMLDEINSIEEMDFRNHGQFVKALAQLMEEWEAFGYISEEEKDILMTCAGGSK